MFAFMMDVLYMTHLNTHEQTEALHPRRVPPWAILLPARSSAPLGALTTVDAALALLCSILDANGICYVSLRLTMMAISTTDRCSKLCRNGRVRRVARVCTLATRRRHDLRTSLSSSRACGGAAATPTPSKLPEALT